ncbi:hypothetical protein [Candidatus Poriferisocius sp.]|uniref:hypothetical protein n=1 Tax=Candidatus Poriferisocius sp. TaxID=3101276 RepID=UPI003B0197B8
MQQLADSDFVPRLVVRYGDEKVQILLASIREVFTYLAPETLTTGITIFLPLTDAAPPLGQGRTIPKSELASLDPPPQAIATTNASSVTCWFDSVDAEELASSAIVYRFDGSDHFVTPDGVIDLPASPAFGSIFATPTFVDLQTALEHYKVHLALRSRCQILRSCWDDDKRLVLRNRPESTMRASLENFLVGTLRGRDEIEVRTEQAVDHSHPVDLKITWSFTNRIAYIELKWLGDSLNRTGTRLTSYRDQRARDGAEQLAEYLDLDKPSSPSHVVMGYLVVLDARRLGLNANRRSITRDQALHFRNQDIKFRVRYEQIRSDFAKPIRMFLEPAL